jgi:hypothetical protein
MNIDFTYSAVFHVIHCGCLMLFVIGMILLALSLHKEWLKDKRYKYFILFFYALVWFMCVTCYLLVIIY